MATLKIFDAHFHVWDLEAQNLDWLDGADPRLQRSFGFDELTDAYSRKEGVTLSGALHVEADVSDAHEEDARLRALMAQQPLLRGFVSHTTLGADMDLAPDAVGIREVLHNDDIPRGRCLEESFIQGLQELAHKGYTFDACVRTPELRDLYGACAQVPDARVIINHCGNAQSLDREFDDAMSSLAELPNTYCKVSGLAYAPRGESEKLLEFLARRFGPERLMYASNWPVIALYSDLNTHLDVQRSVFADDPRIFHDTALKAYGLTG